MDTQPRGSKLAVAVVSSSHRSVHLRQATWTNRIQIAYHYRGGSGSGYARHDQAKLGTKLVVKNTMENVVKNTVDKHGEK